MSDNLRTPLLFLAMTALIVATGMMQGWNLALTIVNMGLISAIMALGVNLQWGFAGLFNIGIMGFVALGGLAAVLVNMPPVAEAWAAGGVRVLMGLVLGAASLWRRSWSMRGCLRGGCGRWPCWRAGGGVCRLSRGV